ncbi:DUF4249 domain-containing protein [Pontibacter fetidus]|uniref:DUF4249 domain-containing protein n=1 Tax=Pontibacter fetidus TaxID=2700082 RepID=A0A6B2H876_9BACT|nr:DUF4249 domain-containing protein [Pontibacter fetidus]NDK56757.1 DUF4249 domain-containing protein [Pontibacter fetidus]
MRSQRWKNTLGWLLMLLVSSCVEPYFPEVMDAPNTYLVVNGFINANGTTNIQLVRTQNLNDHMAPPPESGAIVMIEAENGESFRLEEIYPQGTYQVQNLNLNDATNYRLFIRTNDNKEYASDFIQVKRSPEIDAITWAPLDEEVQLYVSTHDPSNKTRYYRWQFEYTWQFRSPLFTALKYENGAVVPREGDDPIIYNCWKSEKSNTIEYGTSVKLSQDVISNYKLTTIPAGSEKLSVKYSVLVKQYALTKQAYEYWEILKKNTENIGTLFDPLPSQLTGNIRCLTNPDEPVIGFISASTVTEKRAFIDRRELPREWHYNAPSCFADTMLLSENSVSDFFGNGSMMPVNEVYLDGGVSPVGYTYAPKSCVDCRTMGTNVKPYFWE